MVELARGMKQQARQTEELLAQDRGVLDEANRRAEENVVGLDKARDQLAQAIEEYGGWTVWILMAVSVVIFLLMVMFIRVTSFIL